MTAKIEQLQQHVDGIIERGIGATVSYAGLNGVANAERYQQLAGRRFRTTAPHDPTIPAHEARVQGHVKTYVSQCVHLAATLQKVGLQPLAFCPRNAWYEACAHGKMYLFLPNIKEKVRISTAPLDETRKEASWRWMKWLVLAWAAFLPLLSILLFAMLPALGFGLREEIVGGIFILFLIPAVYISLQYVQTQRKRQASVERRILFNRFLKARKTSIEALYQLLWPNFREPKTLDSDVMVRIAFPKASDSVHNALDAVGTSGLRLYIAARADAIMLIDNPVEALVGRLHPEIEDPAPITTGPVVYAMHDNAVAIIAVSDGDLPMSAEDIKRISMKSVLHS
jgi:hypothetical protein